MGKYDNEELKNILGQLDCSYIKLENRILPMYVLKKNLARIKISAMEIEIGLDKINEILDDSWED